MSKSISLKPALPSFERLAHTMRSALRLENFGSLFGALGATVLALNNSFSPYGWLFFLGSNVCFIAFCLRTRLYAMFAMNCVFLATSLLGAYRWLC